MNKNFEIIKDRYKEFIDFFESSINNLFKNKEIKDCNTFTNNLSSDLKKNIILNENESLKLKYDYIYEELSINFQELGQKYSLRFNYYLISDIFKETKSDIQKISLYSLELLDEVNCISFIFSDNHNSIILNSPYHDEKFGVTIRSDGKFLSFIENNNASNVLPANISHINFFKILPLISKVNPNLLLDYIYNNSNMIKEDIDIFKLSHDIDLSDNLFSISLDDRIFNKKLNLKKINKPFFSFFNNK